MNWKKRERETITAKKSAITKSSATNKKKQASDDIWILVLAVMRLFVALLRRDLLDGVLYVVVGI